MKSAFDWNKGPWGFTIDFGATDWAEFGLSLDFCVDPRHAFLDFTFSVLHTWVRFHWIPGYPS